MKTVYSWESEENLICRLRSKLLEVSMKFVFDNNVEKGLRSKDEVIKLCLLLLLSYSTCILLLCLILLSYISIINKSIMCFSSVLISCNNIMEHISNIQSTPQCSFTLSLDLLIPKNCLTPSISMQRFKASLIHALK